MATPSKYQSDQPYTDRMPYVFGSSTPREFSYMNHVPQQYRVYDAKFRRSRRTREEMTLSDYLRQIRSSSPSKRRDRSVETPRSYIFGSSTPRKWSHLEKIPVEYRVYDVDLSRIFRRNKRSKTTSFTPTEYSTKDTFPSKSQSSLGVSRGLNSATSTSSHRNNSSYAKNNARTQSVPPSISSSRHNGASSADSQMSNRSGVTSASSQGKGSKHININLKRHSSRQSSNEKNPSQISTPNEELVLIVTETVTNVDPSSTVDQNQVLPVEHHSPHNIAYSSTAESQQEVPNLELSLTEQGKLAKAIEHTSSYDSPKIVIDEVNLNDVHENGRELNSGEESERDSDTMRNVKKSFDITHDNPANTDAFDSTSSYTKKVVTTIGKVDEDHGVLTNKSHADKVMGFGNNYERKESSDDEH